MSGGWLMPMSGGGRGVGSCIRLRRKQSFKRRGQWPLTLTMSPANDRSATRKRSPRSPVFERLSISGRHQSLRSVLARQRFQPEGTASVMGRTPAKHRLTAGGCAAMTGIFGPDVLADFAVNDKTVIYEKLFAGPDGGDCMNEHAIARLDCLAVGRTRMVRKRAQFPPRLPSITRPSERPKTNVWPTPDR